MVPVHAVLWICIQNNDRRNISPFLTDSLVWTLFNTDSGLNPASNGDPDPQQWSSRDTSVADPGCLSRIPNPTFSIPDPGSRDKKTRIRIKVFMNPPKNFFYALGNMIRDFHPGSVFRILIFYLSGSRGQKGTGSRWSGSATLRDTVPLTLVEKCLPSALRVRRTLRPGRPKLFLLAPSWLRFGSITQKTRIDPMRFFTSVVDLDPGARKLTKLANNLYHSLRKRLLYIGGYVLWTIISYRITNIKYIFHLKNSTFCDGKVWLGVPDPHWFRDPHWFGSTDPDPHYGKRLDPAPHRIHNIVLFYTSMYLLDKKCWPEE